MAKTLKTMDKEHSGAIVTKRNARDLFTNYTLTLHITELRGTLSKNPNLIDDFVSAKAERANKDITQLTDNEKREAAIEGDIARRMVGTRVRKELDEVALRKASCGDNGTPPLETAADVSVAVAPDWPEAEVDPDGAQRVSLGFLSDKDGIYLRSAMVRSALKAAAEALAQHAKKNLNIALFKAKVIDRLHIAEYKLRPTRDGNTIMRPDSAHDHAMHVMTPLGPRTCLKRVDQIDECDLVCTLRIMDADNVINKEIILMLLDYANLQGIGQDRSLGYGRFTYDLEEVTS